MVNSVWPFLNATLFDVAGLNYVAKIASGYRERVECRFVRRVNEIPKHRCDTYLDDRTIFSGALESPRMSSSAKYGGALSSGPTLRRICVMPGEPQTLRGRLPQ